MEHDQAERFHRLVFERLAEIISEAEEERVFGIWVWIQEAAIILVSLAFVPLLALFVVLIWPDEQRQGFGVDGGEWGNSSAISSILDTAGEIT